MVRYMRIPFIIACLLLCLLNIEFLSFNDNASELGYVSEFAPDTINKIFDEKSSEYIDELCKDNEQVLIKEFGNLTYGNDKESDIKNNVIRIIGLEKQENVIDNNHFKDFLVGLSHNAKDK